MPKHYKFLVGLGASLAVGWVSHGPLGGGEAFIQTMESGVQAIVADAEIAGVTGRMQREPLARTAILSGPADRFQRDGQGSLPGLDKRILTVPGVARLEWTNPPP